MEVVLYNGERRVRQALLDPQETQVQLGQLAPMLPDQLDLQDNLSLS